jgi:hypothetical protein
VCTHTGVAQHTHTAFLLVIIRLYMCHVVPRQGHGKFVHPTPSRGGGYKGRVCGAASPRHTPASHLPLFSQA